VQGISNDLFVRGRIAGAGGVILADGRFDVDTINGYGMNGMVGVDGADLQTLLARTELPLTSLTGRVTGAIRGASLATLDGQAVVTIERSTVDSIRIRPSVAALRFGGGRVQVDSLRLASSALMARADGAFGIAPGQRDTLRLSLTADSLGGLRPLLRRADVDFANDTLRGRIQADLTLAGGLDTFDIAGAVQGRGVRASGTQLRHVRLEGNVVGLPHAPTGRLTMHADTVSSGTLRLSSLDGIAEMAADRRMQFGGRAAAEAGPSLEIAGVAEQHADTTIVVLDSVVLRAQTQLWRLTAPARLRTVAGGFALDSFVLAGDSGRIVARGEVPVAGLADFTLTGAGVPVSDLAAVAGLDGSYGGTLELQWHVSGTRLQPRFLADATVTNGQFGTVRLERVTGRVEYADKRAQTAVRLWRAGQVALTAEGRLPVDLSLMSVTERLLPDSLVARFWADSVGLAVVEAFSPEIRNATGTMSADVRVGGTWKDPRIEGALRVADGTARVPRAGLRLRDVQADIAFAGDSVAVRRLTMRSGEQRSDTATLAGFVTLGANGSPAFDLRLAARNFRVMDRPRVASFTATSDLRLRGSTRGSQLTGQVTIPGGEITIPELIQKQLVSLDDPEFYRIVDTSLTRDRNLLPSVLPPVIDSVVRNLSAENVRVAMGDNVWLRSSEANIKLGGAVNVTATQRGDRGTDTTAQLALEGALTTDRGTYRLSLGPVQRSFDVERGTLQFFGEPDLNPTLNIGAVHTVRQFNRGSASDRDVRIRVRIGGTLAQPVLELTDADSLGRSQSDLISYLVTGGPSFEVSGGRGNINTLASVLLPSLSAFTDRLAGGVGLDMLQLQTSGLNRDAGFGQNFTAGNLLAGTRFGVGKQLNDRTFLSANAGLCQFSEIAKSGTIRPEDARQFIEAAGLKVERRFDQGFALSVGIEPGSAQLACASGSSAARGFAPTPRQFSFDLFRRWQF